MKNHYLFSGLCILLFPLITFGQTTPLIDSLVLQLTLEQSDTGKVKLTNRIANHYRNINLQLAGQYAEQSLELAQKTNYAKGQCRALYSLGVIQRMQGNMDQALICGKSGLSIARNDEDWRWAGSHCSALGNTYSSMGVFDSAMVFYIQSIGFYDKSLFPEKKANSYNNIGNMLYKQNKDELALEYLHKALKLYQESGNMKSAAMTLMNLGRREKNDSLAMDYFLRSLDIHSVNNDIQGIASVNMNIGSMLISNENYEAALPYYLRGLELTTSVGHKPKMATANSSLGRIYFELEDQKKAIEHYENAIMLSKKSKFREEEKQTYNNLSILYNEQGNSEKAYDYLKTSRDIGDSLVNERSLAITSELEAKYDTKQKEATLATQTLTIERQKNAKKTIILSGILSLLGITALFQYYFYRQKRKQQEALLAFEKEKAEAAKLREIDELKTKFFANISHELKTPLSMVITPLEEALLKSSDENLLLAHKNSKKLFRLIKEILDLSKLEAGQLELNESPVLLYQLTSQILNSFQSLAKRRKITFVQNFGLPHYTKVLLDAEKFEKILSNLLSNAVKFSSDGASIQLDINRKTTNKKTLVLKVTDAGIGIPPNDLDQIFNRYFQNENGKNAGGTGIGLALSKELAKLFGGDLTAESKLNQGSVFTLEIPLNEVDYDSEKTEINAPDENFSISKTKIENENILFHPNFLNEKKPSILIVEDNVEMSDYLTKMLSPLYLVQTALNGKEAIKKLESNHFDLITSDVKMPEIDGFKLKEVISQNTKLQHIPFIMLTASTLKEDKLKGLSLGVDDYITKPFNSQELLARISNLLKNKQERALFQKDKKEQPETLDNLLLKHAKTVVLKNIHDPKFKVNDLAKELGYSQRQLTRIFKRLTGLSPVGFILEIRLQKAYQLFQDQQFSTVSEIRYEIGIESAAYFTTKFKERFGKSPKEYLVS